MTCTAACRALIGRNDVGHPLSSHSRRNRQDIAAHETQVVARLRAIEQAYRTAIDHDTAYRLPDLTQTSLSPESQPARQSDLEAEP